MTLFGVYFLSLALRKFDPGASLPRKMTCSLCGYIWEERSGDVPPTVTVRPELIQRGAEKLEEEARRRRDE